MSFWMPMTHPWPVLATARAFIGANRRAGAPTRGSGAFWPKRFCASLLAQRPPSRARAPVASGSLDAPAPANANTAIFGRPPNSLPISSPAAEFYFRLADFTAALTMSLVDGAAAIDFGTGFFGFLASRFPRFFSEAMATSFGSAAMIAHSQSKAL